MHARGRWGRRRHTACSHAHFARCAISCVHKCACITGPLHARGSHVNSSGRRWRHVGWGHRERSLLCGTGGRRVRGIAVTTICTTEVVFDTTLSASPCPWCSPRWGWLLSLLRKVRERDDEKSACTCLELKNRPESTQFIPVFAGWHLPNQRPS